MANCVMCGAKAGFRFKVCDECRAKQVELETKELEKDRKAREQARKQQILDEHSRIIQDVKDGFRCLLHKTVFVSVDSEITGASFEFASYDDSYVKLCGLEGWRVVGTIQRTFGTLLKNQDGFNSVWAGGTGGNVTGAYVLMELELTPTNVERMSEEILEYLNESF